MTSGTQKKVRFHIEIDGPTLNIFAEDDAVGMPVRLHRRSSGFRWHVSFAWKFTHASKGLYQGCILLLEEPGIHLHHSVQRDLLEVFERLSESNTILYTTHLASMVDPAFPERVRIVETEENHATVKSGVVSSQRAPMAVVELALGLTGDMSGLLGNRQTLIVGRRERCADLAQAVGTVTKRWQAISLRTDLSVARTRRTKDPNVRGVRCWTGLGFRSSA